MNRKLFLAAVAAASMVSQAASAATPRVIASLTQPPGGLDCEHAADRAKVVFDFQQPRSDLKQLSVFVNGEGVREKDIDKDWPTVTVRHGLHPGRNTVEAVATGRDGKAVSHKLVVLVGERPRAEERDVAIVDCVGTGRQSARAEPDDDSPWGEVLDDDGDVLEEAEDDYDEVVDEVVYEGPRYVYYPYPTFVFGYAPVYYYPWPYYYSNYYYPYHRHHYYSGGYYGGYYGGHSSSRSNVWLHSGGSRDSERHYQPTRPPTHSGGSAYQHYDSPRRDSHRGDRNSNLR